MVHMKDLNRRRFIKESATLLATLPFLSFLAPQKETTPIKKKELFRKGQHYKKLAG